MSCSVNCLRALLLRPKSSDIQTWLMVCVLHIWITDPIPIYTSHCLFPKKDISDDHFCFSVWACLRYFCEIDPGSMYPSKLYFKRVTLLFPEKFSHKAGQDNWSRRDLFHQWYGALMQFACYYDQVSELTAFVLLRFFFFRTYYICSPSWGFFFPCNGSTLNEITVI